MQWFIKSHVSTVKIDYWLEWDESSCVSFLPMVNSNDGDVSQIVNHCAAFKDRYYAFYFLTL